MVDVMLAVKELRFSLLDKPDPQLNSILALERLIAIVERVKEDLPHSNNEDRDLLLKEIEEYLRPFPSQYE